MSEKEVNSAGADVDALAKKEPSAFSKFVRKHPIITTAIFGLLLAGAVYLWKEVEGNFQRKALIKEASVQLQENNRRMLQLFCKPLVWNVRSEMLRGNMEQVNLLLTDVVKESHFQYIQLVKPDGSVLLSTDKKAEGQRVSDEKVKGALGADSTVIFQEEDNRLTLVAPVMGYDKRLGTLVVSYKPEVFQAETDKK